ncbi:MAG: acyl-CoA reductase [Hyphomonadaceae bacterium]
MNTQANPPPLPVPHVIKGETVFGADQNYGRFATPTLDLDAMVWPRSEPAPARDVPVAEIMDVLVELGDRLTRDPDSSLTEALERSVKTNPLPRDVLERSYASLGRIFNRKMMEFQVEEELGGADVIDGWRDVKTTSGRPARIRAFPTRLVHIIAGNAPGVAAQSVIRGALTKCVNLFKLPSNDLYSATAILRALSAVAPGHPVAKSFSAAYWRGGDAGVEGMLFRPQFFDKIVAWGGESTIRGALKYVGPGFELVAFDPKTSISMIGREAFVSEETLEAVATRGAFDATIMNQQACTSSRFQFIEGTVDEVDRYCTKLQAKLGEERPTSSCTPIPIPGNLRDELDGLRAFENEYRVFGGYEGRGLVVRSDAPVDFYPDNKIVNVVRVADLRDAIRHVSVATQTVGVYPATRRTELRDALCSAGTQRVVALGLAQPEGGLPHDGFYPLHRFVRWVTDEGGND